MSRAHALIEQVIRPVSETLVDTHPVLEEVLVGAATLNNFNPWEGVGQESLGLFGISPRLHRQVWDQFLAYRPEKASLVRGYASQHRFLQAPDEELVNNTCYAAAIAICALLWVREAWPPENDVAGLTRLWADLAGWRETQTVARLESAMAEQLETMMASTACPALTG